MGARPYRAGNARTHRPEEVLDGFGGREGLPLVVVPGTDRWTRRCVAVGAPGASEDIVPDRLLAGVCESSRWMHRVCRSQGKCADVVACGAETVWRSCGRLETHHHWYRSATSRSATASYREHGSGAG